MSPLPPLSSAGLPPARTRGPPPSDWSWSPAAFPLDFTSLPPLPTIRSAALAAQAVTTKNYHGDLAGRPKRFTYDDEIGSYRRLEWLGDAALHPAYAKHLFRLFPEAGSGALSVSSAVRARHADIRLTRRTQTIRGELHSNVTQAHLAYAYELDLKILEPRKPKNPRTFWRPLAQNQNIVADVFEAYIGALTEEDRENEVAEWVGALLERNKEQVRRRVAELIARACEPLPLSRAEYRKRSLEQNSFEGGSELGTSGAALVRSVRVQWSDARTLL